MSKLILGTAQFGQDYGIKHDGQPSVDEIRKIAKVAWDGGIRTIHTSWQYNFEHIDIFDDFNKIEKDREYPDVFHYKGMKGISVYAKRGGTIPDIDIYQIPVNILDKRHLDFASFCKRWAVEKPNLEIHARSVFLQGLLLMVELPDWLPQMVKLTIRCFHLVSKAEGREYYESALGWVLGLDEVDKVIVGVNSAKQLEQLLAVKPFKWDLDFSIDDDMALDPRRWPR